jgi:hypothetical protein
MVTKVRVEMEVMGKRWEAEVDESTGSLRGHQKENESSGKTSGHNRRLVLHVKFIFRAAFRLLAASLVLVHARSVQRIACLGPSRLRFFHCAHEPRDSPDALATRRGTKSQVPALMAGRVCRECRDDRWVARPSVTQQPLFGPHAEESRSGSVRGCLFCGSAFLKPTRRPAK